MKKIVTIGGGTGSYTVLMGIKKLDGVDISALVSMADNGGSTGLLRDELGVLPPGDVRQCLVALSDHTEIVRELMNYRFKEGGLSGHSFGNLFLAALEKVTGDFVKGVEVISDILKVRGKVIPITRDKAELSAELGNGEKAEGQVGVDEADFIKKGLKKIFYKNDVNLSDHAREAILSADYIVIGPGNYYESLIPNLIVNGFQEALQESKAKIIFPVNLTNKQEHTKGWNVSDYVKDLEMYLGKKVDYVLVNTEKPSDEQIERYKLEEGEGVMVKDGIDSDQVVRESLISHTFYNYDKSDSRSHARSFIRHDSDKLAQCINKIIKA